MSCVVGFLAAGNAGPGCRVAGHPRPLKCGALPISFLVGDYRRVRNPRNESHDRSGEELSSERKESRRQGRGKRARINHALKKHSIPHTPRTTRKPAKKRTRAPYLYSPPLAPPIVHSRANSNVGMVNGPPAMSGVPSILPSFFSPVSWLGTVRSGKLEKNEVNGRGEEQNVGRVRLGI